MTDDVFLITGASRGIGAATAKLAAEAGYRLALTGRDANALAALAETIGRPDRVLTATCDVTDWAQMRDLVDRVVGTYGRLDIALANAGANTPTSFLGTRGAEPDAWRDMVLTNVYGPALTARATLPALTETRGHLVLIGSVAGRNTRAGNLYAVTKWAVSGLAEAIRAEVTGKGVRTTIVQPGLVDTTMADHYPETDPRLDPDDIGRAVLYAVTQPENVDINEVVVRPTGQVR